MTLDHPICRAALVCPVCGGTKDVGLVMCWPCYRGGKFTPNFGSEALERFESNPERIAAFNAGEHE